MKVIVDRIENNYVVVELVTEGDIVHINILKEETKLRKEKINKLADKLFK